MGSNPYRGDHFYGDHSNGTNHVYYWTEIRPGILASAIILKMGRWIFMAYKIQLDCSKIINRARFTKSSI